eukprot:TRINITY_DN3695_c0_g1_i10.p1 TRINITY_DN3695_c0_g1~~TRINITY_DN3695_c0_g1_i10.p1  ORF type:complete len:210 (+),score=39.62 TRINITY_DN3695_c0_g1_i10:223-852(+)
MTHLAVIQLHNNELTFLPEGLFAGLGNLREISLAYNKLKSLPEGLFDELHNLEQIQLFGNQLTCLPVGLFFGLKKLRRINLSFNKLRSFPTCKLLPTFLGCAQLETLDISLNHELEVPDSSIWNGLRSLERISAPQWSDGDVKEALERSQEKNWIDCDEFPYLVLILHKRQYWDPDLAEDAVISEIVYFVVGRGQAKRPRKKGRNFTHQ